jgi:hypothetical protein
VAVVTDRREFLGQFAAGAMMGAVPLSLESALRAVAPSTPGEAAETWDLSWTNRVKGKYRVVLDSPEISSGYGVWRSSFWAKQYQDVLGAKPSDTSTVLVLRHNGIALAMQQSFWDKYGIGKLKNVTHPVTEEPTTGNPALFSSTRGEVPAQFDDFALDKLMGRGGIVLACNLALQDMIGLVQKNDGVSAEESRTRAVAALVPGVILQPSGVFAVLHAQDVGCNYIMAS